LPRAACQQGRESSSVWSSPEQTQSYWGPCSPECWPIPSWEERGEKEGGREGGREGGKEREVKEGGEWGLVGGTEGVKGWWEDL